MKFRISILFVFGFLGLKAQVLPDAAAWGNTLVTARTQNRDSVGFLKLSQIAAFSSGLSWKVGGNSVSAASILGTTTNYDLIFQTNNTERMRILSNGNIGIGVSNPDKLVNIYKNSSYNTEDGAIYIQTGANGTNAGMMLGVDKTAGIAYIQGVEPSTSWASKPLVLNPNGGNVGVSNNAPSYKLDITGQARTSSDFWCGDNFNVANSSGSGWFRFDGYADYLYFWANTPVGYRFGNDIDGTKATILSTGEFGIGVVPTEKLHINGRLRLNTTDSGANTDSIATLSPTGVLNKRTLSSILTNVPKLNEENFFTTIQNFTDINMSGNFVADGNVTATNGVFVGTVQSANATAGVHLMNRNSSDARYTQIGGSLTLGTLVVTTGSNSITVNASNYCIIFSGATSGNSMTFPSASSCIGRIYIVINRTNNLIPLTGGYIEGTSTIANFATFSQTQLISDGTNWIKIN